MRSHKYDDSCQVMQLVAVVAMYNAHQNICMLIIITLMAWGVLWLNNPSWYAKTPVDISKQQRLHLPAVHNAAPNSDLMLPHLFWCLRERANRVKIQGRRAQHTWFWICLRMKGR